MNVAELMDETDLAWALAEAVKPYLSAAEHHHVFMAIGAGETYSAIRGLFRSVAIKRIALRPDLVQRCTTWIHAYAGHREERYLRRLAEDYLIPLSIHVPAAVRVSRQPQSASASSPGCAYQPLRHTRKPLSGGPAWLRCPIRHGDE
jgi:hypothetical protein